jgi:hypothetical protein
MLGVVAIRNSPFSITCTICRAAMLDSYNTLGECTQNLRVAMSKQMRRETDECPSTSAFAALSKQPHGTRRRPQGLQQIRGKSNDRFCLVDQQILVGLSTQTDRPVPSAVACATTSRLIKASGTAEAAPSCRDFLPHPCHASRRLRAASERHPHSRRNISC